MLVNVWKKFSLVKVKLFLFELFSSKKFFLFSLLEKKK